MDRDGLHAQSAEDLGVGAAVRLKLDVEAGGTTSKEYESFMVNSRTRSRPPFGRGSSRNLVCRWYQSWGNWRYDDSSVARRVKISSWVIARRRSASLRSLNLTRIP
jgi:hypothetical protein